MQKDRAKLLLTMIVKDDSEYKDLSRCLSSFMPYFDGLAVALTGLSKKFKKTKKLIKKYNGQFIETSPATHPEIYEKDDKGDFFASFANARNASFDLASKMQKDGKYDFWAWADTDDVLISGEELNKCALMAKKANLDSVFFTYWYAVRLTPEGDIKDVVIEHLRERLVKPNVFKWVSRLHEVAIQKDDNYSPRQTEYEFNQKEGRLCVWAHMAQMQKFDANIERNTRILEFQAKEEEHKDPRTLFYLAKTYYDLKVKEKDQLALFLLNEYLELSGWGEERSNAWEYIALIKSRGGDKVGAIQALHEAIKEYPNRHMPYLHLAGEYSALGRHEEANFWTDVALKMSPPKARTTIGNPLDIKVMAASLKFNEAIRGQRLEEAIYWLKIRNTLTEEDNGMVKTLEDAKLLNEMGQSVFRYAKWLKDTGNTSKISHLLKSLPLDLGREPFAAFIANEVGEARKWSKNEICYYASWGAEHFEKWSPKNIDTGIGGSETAVIELAKKWAELGFKVTVYGDPRDEEGEYEGVAYRPWYEINWKDEFNILILWRSPHLLDKDIKAKKIFMDLHDIASQLDWTEERMKKIDKVFFKSDFHRGMVPKLPEGKAVVVSNGI